MRTVSPGFAVYGSGGTSDVPVAEEAIETLRMAGIGCRRFFDVGVAGLHRLLAVLPELNLAEALIVIAGMDRMIQKNVTGKKMSLGS